MFEWSLNMSTIYCILGPSLTIQTKLAGRFMALPPAQVLKAACEQSITILNSQTQYDPKLLHSSAFYPVLACITVIYTFCAYHRPKDLGLRQNDTDSNPAPMAVDIRWCSMNPEILVPIGANPKIPKSPQVMVPHWQRMAQIQMTYFWICQGTAANAAQRNMLQSLQIQTWTILRVLQKCNKRHRNVYKSNLESWQQKQHKASNSIHEKLLIQGLHLWRPSGWSPKSNQRILFKRIRYSCFWNRSKKSAGLPACFVDVLVIHV